MLMNQDRSPFTHGMQLRLSQILSSPACGYRFQSDCCIVAQREGGDVDIDFCKPDYSEIEYSLTVQGVGTVGQIRVKYFVEERKAIIVHRIPGGLYLFSGKLDFTRDSRRSSQLENIQERKVAWGEGIDVLEISQIYFTNEIGAHCLIITKTGEDYLLQFNTASGMLSIEPLMPQSRPLSILKNIFKPIMAPKRTFNRSFSFLHSYGPAETLHSVVLVDSVLKATQFNLWGRRAQNTGSTWARVCSWELDLLQAQAIDPQSQILTCLFVPYRGQQQENLMTIVLACCNSQNNIDVYELGVDLDSGQYQLKVSTQILGKPENQVDFQQQSHGVQMIHHDGAVHLLVQIERVKHRARQPFLNIQNYLANLRINRLDHQQQQNQKMDLSPLSLSEQAGRACLAKTSLLDQRTSTLRQRLFLVGEVNSYEFGQANGQETQQPWQSWVPPPAYQQNNLASERASIEIGRIIEENGRLEYTAQPFNKKSIREFTESKNVPMLLKLLEKQGGDFEREVCQSGVLELKKYTDHLVGIILLKLLTVQNGYERQPNKQAINKAITGGLDTDGLIEQLFMQRSVDRLRLLLERLLEQKLLLPVVEVCCDILPNFLASRHADLESRRLSEPDGQPELVRLQQIDDFVRVNFLQWYELILKNISQGVKPIQDKHRQLLSSYLYARRLTLRVRGENIATLHSILRTYSNSDPRYRKVLVDEAISHRDISVFDFLLTNRMVTRDDIHKFVEAYGEDEQHPASLLLQLFINLVNTELTEAQKKQYNFHSEAGLEVLLWVPAQFQAGIYQHLLQSWFRVAIVYGLLIKSRREVAKDLVVHVDKLGEFADCKCVLDVLEPLYSLPRLDKIVKLAVDVAWLLAPSSEKFVSPVDLLKPDFVKKIPVRQPQRLKQFQARINYLDESQKTKVKVTFSPRG